MRRQLDFKRLTVSRGLYIAGGTLLIGAALGWVQPPPLLIVIVALLGVVLLLYGLRQIEAPAPCGNPAERRERIQTHAGHLKRELDNFEIWLPALKDQNFKGKLPGGAQRSTHAKAMQALLYVFAKFFSVVRIYEIQCRAKPEETLMKRVREVYDALGLGGGGDTDELIDSMELHAIGEGSTKFWGDVEAQPRTELELRAAIKTDPVLDESFEQLRLLLRAAGPGTEARLRLQKTADALGRVHDE
jgi:hypothetical protein